MYYSIAVYPQTKDSEESRRWQTYMEQAYRQGFNEVFLSLHLPEFTLKEQLALLEELAGEAQKRNMCVTVDVGGPQLAQLLADRESGARICRARVGFVRLDYGFSMEQAEQIWREWQVKGFVINASIFNWEELVKLKTEFLKLDAAVELRACHNYYPRPESGLSYDFFLRQNRMLARLEIPVYACIPDQEHPRGPVGKGLPTVETHRFMELEQIVRQLTAGPGCEGLMAADEEFSQEKLERIVRAAECYAKTKPGREAWVETLSVFWQDGVSEAEKQIVCGQIHHIRYDSNEWLLRSQSSREMAEYAEPILPRPMAERRRGMVTIDNAGYGRYSGELQIVMADRPGDSRVNVAGQIAERDMWKLSCYRDGCEYRFESLGQLRHLQEGDTAEAVALWNRSRPDCPMDAREWAGVVLADENYDPKLCLCVERDGRMEGLVVGVVRRYPYLERGREEGRAFILALAVEPKMRGKGIGGHLLEALEAQFKQRGCTRITMGAYSPYYFMAGVPAGETAVLSWLERRGYVRGEAAYWMERSLAGYERPAYVVKREECLREDGFDFIPYEACWAGALLAFLEKEFSTGWRVHAMRAIQQRRLEGRCFLCCRDGRVAGYVQRGAGGEEGRFGPFGVAAAYRGRGLGAVLLHRMWESMQKAGLESVYFRSTEENGRRLYERHGMYVKQAYYHFEKTEDGWSRDHT